MCMCVCKGKNVVGMCVLVYNRWTTKKHAAKGQYNQYPRYNKTQNAVMKGITLRKHHRKTYFPKLFGLVFISLPGLEPYQQPVDQTINSMAIGPGPQNVRHFWVEESSGINATKDRFGLICTHKEMNKTTSYTQIVSSLSPFLKIVRSFWGLKEKKRRCFNSWSSKLNFPGSSRFPLTLKVKRSVWENHHYIAG